MKRSLPQRREARQGLFFAFFAALRFLCLLTVASSACSAQTSWSVPLNPDVPLVKQIRLPVELTAVLKGVFLKAGAKEDPTPKPVRVLIAPPQPAYVVPIVVKLRTRESETTNPAEVTKAQPATLPGTNLPSVYVAPVDISSLTRSASLAPVVDQKAALYLERLRQGDTSPEVFDYLKQLSFTEIVKLIEAVSVWQSTEDKRLLRSLAKTLIDHHGISDEKTAGLPNAAVLALADYYKDQSSERCVKLYEGLLTKRKTKADGFVPELNGLAEYYRKVGNHVKAAETYLRAESYSADKPFLANFTIEAARDYMQAGDEKKANELYAGVGKYGYGWATGGANYDRAINLISKGEYSKAREVLSKPVVGQYADQNKVVLMGTTAYSYYCEGKLEAAETSCKETLEYYKTLSSPLRGEGLEYWTYSCKVMQEQIANWRKEPLRANLTQLLLHPPVDRADGKKVVGTFLVRTCLDVPIEAESSHPGVKCSVANKGKQGWYCFEREVQVEANLDALPKEPLSVKVTSSAHPGRELRVAVISQE